MRAVGIGLLLVAMVVSGACSGSSGSGEPELRVEPAVLDFGTDTDSLELRIENTGGGDLEWELYCFAGWVSYSQDSGHNDATVTITVDRDHPGMNTGINTANLLVTAFVAGSKVADSQVEIQVEKLAAGDPVLSLDVEELNFGPNRDSLSFTIANSGGGLLQWQASVDQPWLSLEPTSGGNYSSVEISADRSGLAPGSYSGMLSVTSNGGDASIPVTLVAFDPNSNYRLDEFFPLQVGNTWQWQQQNAPYYWKITITDKIQKNGVNVWAAQLEDAWATTKELYLVYAGGFLNVISSYDADLLDQLPDIDLRNSCREWENDCSFPLFSEDLTPREDYDPYYKTRLTYVPGSLAELIDTYGITDSSMTSADFPLGDLPDCIGVLESSSNEGSKLYQIFCRGHGPVLWDYWPRTYENVGGNTRGQEVEPYRGGISVVNRPDSNLLFYAYDDYNWYFAYVFGVRLGDSMRPTHVVLTDYLGTVYSVVTVNEDFLPVQFSSEGQNITVYNLGPPGQENQPGPFDPTQAYLVAYADGRKQEGRLNIYPEPLAQLLDDIENNFTDLTPVRQLLSDNGITTYQQLVDLAKQAGPEQARFQALALGIAFSALVERLQQGSTMRFLPLDIALDIGLALLNDKIGNALCIHCPDLFEPVVNLLLCQGLLIPAPVQICDYSFFWDDKVMPCIEYCTVTTSCFTNICQPVEVSAEWVKKQLENNSTGIAW